LKEISEKPRTLVMTTTKDNKTVEAGAILSLRSMKYSTSCVPLYIDAIKVNLTILLDTVDTVKTFAQFVQDPPRQI
jgi:hypothetical protein